MRLAGTVSVTQEFAGLSPSIDIYFFSLNLQDSLKTFSKKLQYEKKIHLN